MADIEIAAAMSFDGAQVVTQVKVITTEVEKAKTSLEALSGVLDDVKKGFSAVTGTLDLFGIKSEGVQKALEKVKAALDVAEGLQSISKLGEGFDKLNEAVKASNVVQGVYNFLMKGSVAATVENTVAIDAQAVSLEGQTGATVAATGASVALGIAMRAAFLATGIGAVVIAIVALVSALDDSNNSADEAIKKQKEYNDIMGSASSGYKQAYTEIEQLKIEFAEAGANADKQKAAMEHFNSTVGESTKQINSFSEGQAFLSSPTETKAYVDAMLARATATAAIGKAADANLDVMAQDNIIKNRLAIYKAQSLKMLKEGTFTKEGAEKAAKALKMTDDDFINTLIKDYQKQIGKATTSTGDKVLDDAIQLKNEAYKTITSFTEDAKASTLAAEKIATDHGWGKATVKNTQDGADAAAKIIENHYQNLLEKNDLQEKLAINAADRDKETEDQKFQIQVDFQNKKINLLQDYYDKIADKQSDAAITAKKSITQAQNDLVLLQDNYYTKSITDLDAYIKNFGNELKKHEKDLQPPPPPEDKDPNNYDGPGALPFGLGPNGVRPGYEGAATKGLLQLHGMQDFSNSLQGLTTDGDKLNAQAGRGVSGFAGHFAEQLKALQDFHTKAKDLATKGYGDMKAVDKAYADAKVNLFLSVGSQILGSAADLFGKQTAAGKAISIAQTTIDTYQSATAAYKAVVGIPVVGPALAPVAAGAAVLSGLANIKKILAVQVPGQSSGGGALSVDTSTPAAPLTPSPVQTSTTLNQAQINQIGNAASRVYVLDSDIQNNRERDARLNRAARLGG